MPAVEISRLDEATVEVWGLNPFLADLLKQIVSAADPSGCDAAEARLYSTPTAGAEPEFDVEWEELIQPDLEEYFASSLDIVQTDLVKMPSHESALSDYRLRIPMDHLESWIHALNQARLALVARYDISEKEMSNLPLQGDLRALSVFQVHFYGFIQECFLREMDGGE